MDALLGKEILIRTMFKDDHKGVLRSLGTHDAYALDVFHEDGTLKGSVYFLSWTVTVL